MGPFCCDVRRQWHFPDAGDRVVESGAREGKAKQHLTSIGLFLDFRVQRGEKTGGAFRTFAEPDAVSYGQPLRGSNEGAPLVGRLPLVECCLDVGDALAAHTDAVKSGWNDARVVDDENVPRE